MAPTLRPPGFYRFEIHIYLVERRRATTCPVLVDPIPQLSGCVVVHPLLVVIQRPHVMNIQAVDQIRREE